MTRGSAYRSHLAKPMLFSWPRPCSVWGSRQDVSICWVPSDFSPQFTKYLQSKKARADRSGSLVPNGGYGSSSFSHMVVFVKH